MRSLEDSTFYDEEMRNIARESLNIQKVSLAISVILSILGLLLSYKFELPMTQVIFISILVLVVFTLFSLFYGSSQFDNKTSMELIERKGWHVRLSALIRILMKFESAVNPKYRKNLHTMIVMLLRFNIAIAILEGRGELKKYLDQILNKVESQN